MFSNHRTYKVLLWVCVKKLCVMLFGLPCQLRCHLLRFPLDLWKNFALTEYTSADHQRVAYWGGRIVFPLLVTILRKNCKDNKCREFCPLQVRCFHFCRRTNRLEVMGKYYRACSSKGRKTVFFSPNKNSIFQNHSYSTFCTSKSLFGLHSMD